MVDLMKLNQQNLKQQNLNKGNLLSDQDFAEIRELVFDQIGVNLTEKKRPLIISRLSRRLVELKFSDFSEYLDFLKKNPEEYEVLFNLITTNVTKFFREQDHFDYLNNILLNSFLHKTRKVVRVWSAGCSTGEEPYSLAITLKEFYKKQNWSIQMLASDINTQVLSKAKKGIYRESQITNISYNLLKKYFKLGTGKNEGLFKVKHTLKNVITFRKINLTDNKPFPIDKKLDFIFCRNVFIYFNKTTQIKVLDKFHDTLKNGGHLFLGHSETIDLRNPTEKNWQLIKPTIYKKI
jgi:chemotaxis protein methyltransferase CheR